MLPLKIKNYVTTIHDWPALVAKVVSILAIVFSAYILIALIYFFYAQQLSISIMQNENVKSSPPIAIHDIPKWHLFGQADISSTASITNLPLKLLGVIINSDNASSAAIISYNDHEEKMYHLNDQLPGNAILSKILPYAVIILRDGKYERLPLLNAENEAENGNSVPPSNINNQAMPMVSNDLLQRIGKWKGVLAGRE